mmetsp:Transcript_23452/g.54659  ORF Transcript_23452/g.54659 Transcript_23452/m.54659 type:complete len:1652 (+) Transcript_23452:69-5024(+)
MQGGANAFDRLIDRALFGDHADGHVETPVGNADRPLLLLRALLSQNVQARAYARRLLLRKVAARIETSAQAASTLAVCDQPVPKQRLLALVDLWPEGERASLTESLQDIHGSLLQITPREPSVDSDAMDDVGRRGGFSTPPPRAASLGTPQWGHDLVFSASPELPRRSARDPSGGVAWRDSSSTATEKRSPASRLDPQFMRVDGSSSTLPQNNNRAPPRSQEERRHIAAWATESMPEAAFASSLEWPPRQLDDRDLYGGDHLTHSCPMIREGAFLKMPGLVLDVGPGSASDALPSSAGGLAQDSPDDMRGLEEVFEVDFSGRRLHSSSSCGWRKQGAEWSPLQDMTAQPRPRRSRSHNIGRSGSQPQPASATSNFRAYWQGSKDYQPLDSSVALKVAEATMDATMELKLPARDVHRWQGWAGKVQSNAATNALADLRGVAKKLTLTARQQLWWQNFASRMLHLQVQLVCSSLAMAAVGCQKAMRNAERWRAFSSRCALANLKRATSSFTALPAAAQQLQAFCRACRRIALRKGLRSWRSFVGTGQSQDSSAAATAQRFRILCEMAAERSRSQELWRRLKVFRSLAADMAMTRMQAAGRLAANLHAKVQAQQHWAVHLLQRHVTRKHSLAREAAEKLASLLSRRSQSTLQFGISKLHATALQRTTAAWQQCQAEKASLADDKKSGSRARSCLMLEKAFGKALRRTVWSDWWSRHFMLLGGAPLAWQLEQMKLEQERLEQDGMLSEARVATHVGILWQGFARRRRAQVLHHLSLQMRQVFNSCSSLRRASRVANALACRALRELRRHRLGELRQVLKQCSLAHHRLQGLSHLWEIATMRKALSRWRFAMRRRHAEEERIKQDAAFACAKANAAWACAQSLRAVVMLRQVSTFRRWQASAKSVTLRRAGFHHACERLELVMRHCHRNRVASAWGSWQKTIAFHAFHLLSAQDATLRTLCYARGHSWSRDRQVRAAFAAWMAAHEGARRIHNAVKMLAVAFRRRQQRMEREACSHLVINAATRGFAAQRGLSLTASVRSRRSNRLRYAFGGWRLQCSEELIARRRLLEVAQKALQRWSIRMVMAGWRRCVTKVAALHRIEAMLRRVRQSNGFHHWHAQLLRLSAGSASGVMAQHAVQEALYKQRAESKHLVQRQGMQHERHVVRAIMHTWKCTAASEAALRGMQYSALASGFSIIKVAIRKRYQSSLQQWRAALRKDAEDSASLQALVSNQHQGKLVQMHKGLLLLDAVLKRHNKVSMSRALHYRWRNLRWQGMLSTIDAAAAREQRRWRLECDSIRSELRSSRHEVSELKQMELAEVERNDEAQSEARTIQRAIRRDKSQHEATLAALRSELRVSEEREVALREAAFERMHNADISVNETRSMILAAEREGAIATHNLEQSLHEARERLAELSGERQVALYECMELRSATAAAEDKCHAAAQQEAALRGRTADLQNEVAAANRAAELESVAAQDHIKAVEAEAQDRVRVWEQHVQQLETQQKFTSELQTAMVEEQDRSIQRLEELLKEQQDQLRRDRRDHSKGLDQVRSSVAATESKSYLLEEQVDALRQQLHHEQAEFRASEKAWQNDRSAFLTAVSSSLDSKKASKGSKRAAASPLVATQATPARAQMAMAGPPLRHSFSRCPWHGRLLANT